MRGFKIAVPVVLTAMMATTALAADTARSKKSSGSATYGWTLRINGGGSFPTGNFQDEANTGYDVGVQADWWMNSQWGFGVDASYHANRASDSFNSSQGPNANGKFSVIQYGALATFMIPVQDAQIYPYLQGGLSGYDLKTKVDGISPAIDESSNKFGFNIGGGVDFRATDVVSLGVAGTYHYVPSAITGGTSDKAANWFSLRGRVTFKVPMGK